MEEDDPRAGMRIPRPPPSPEPQVASPPEPEAIYEPKRPRLQTSDDALDYWNERFEAVSWKRPLQKYVAPFRFRGK